jgi:aerobic carbon-monoxide dehydrogenase medium subunit
VTDWHRPTSLDEALALRARLGEEASLVGGGVFVALLINQGLLRPEALIALDRVPELRGIGLEADGTLRLGASARLGEVARHPAVPAFLARAYGGVANERVRNQGTVGGNLCEADYASDPPCVLAALGASVRLAGRAGQRDVPLGRFLKGHYETDLRPDELLVAVRVPPLPPGTAGHYIRFVSRSSEDRPCAGVAAVLSPDGRATVAVGAVEAVPRVFAEVDDPAAQLDPIDDLRGSTEYRRKVVRALIPRAIRAAREAAA